MKIMMRRCGLKTTKRNGKRVEHRTEVSWSDVEETKDESRAKEEG